MSNAKSKQAKPKTGLARCMESVSYTHLDVYKRQSVDRAGILPEAAGRETNRHDFPVDSVWNL